MALLTGVYMVYLVLAVLTRTRYMPVPVHDIPVHDQYPCMTSTRA